ENSHDRNAMLASGLDRQVCAKRSEPLKGERGEMDLLLLHHYHPFLLLLLRLLLLHRRRHRTQLPPPPTAAARASLHAADGPTPLRSPPHLQSCQLLCPPRSVRVSSPPVRACSLLFSER
ncbi:unnamed protein product, partial [Nesidiocoris tenuis]